MTASFLQDQFRTRLDDLPGTAATRAAREEAMSAFSEAGYPTRKWEDWRYTDLNRISSVEFDPIPGPPSEDVIAQARQLVDQSVLAHELQPIVFIDGHRSDAFGPLPDIEGLEILDLGDTDDQLLRSQSEAADKDGPLAALNTAFSAGGIHIVVAADTVIETALQLIFLSSEQPAVAQQPRIAINLASGAQITVIQQFLGDARSASWTNAVTKIAQAPGSELRLYRVQDHADEQFHTELLSAELADDSNLEVGYMDLGGALVRNDIQIDLAGPNARCDLFGLFVANEGQHVDNHIRIDHSAPETRSQQTFRSIIGDQGRGVFSGKVVVHKDAQKIDAQQSSDNLLLSERGEIDTKPELEIYADDVKCAHGATVGQLDEEQLFYLRARGMNEKTARGLLTFAFANAILLRLQNSALRERVTDKVLERLPGQQHVDEFL
ncbi:MAG: Fe-S cluster assembly protein SufD [Candidatus Rariloculaceae bacterium]